MQQPINPFNEESSWAADELVKIAKGTDMPLKERIALLKDICDRGGLVKGTASTKKVLSLQYAFSDPVKQSEGLLDDISKLEEARRSIDERLRRGVPEPGGDAGGSE